MQKLGFSLRSEASLINPWAEVGFEQRPTIVIITSDKNSNNASILKMGVSIVKIFLPSGLPQNNSSIESFVEEKLKEALPLIEKSVQVVEEKPKEVLPPIEKNVRAKSSYRDPFPKRDPVPTAPVAKRGRTKKTNKKKNLFKPSREVLEARMIYYDGNLQELLEDVSIGTNDINVLRAWIGEYGLEHLCNPRQQSRFSFLKNKNRPWGGFFVYFACSIIFSNILG